uniref:Redox-regulatory protein FAM213A n=2 Tax=Acanthochromis polyacanthus TaxID=80966 RepID=A0A3Q1GJ81_9TELE
MALELVGNVAATIGGLVAGAMNFLTDLFLTKPLKATLQYLEEAELKTLQGDVKTFKAETLWEKSGAVIMAVRRPG